MDANVNEGEIEDVSCEQDNLYVIAIEANKETNSGTCTNTMDKYINSESGSGRGDKIVV